MLTSMTGYGIVENMEDGFSVVVDIKSLNSRFLDIQCKLNRSLKEYEPKINALVKKYLLRGRIIVNIDISYETSKFDKISFDKIRFKQYMAVIEEIEKENKKIKPVDINYFLSNPEIIIKDTNYNKEIIESCIEKSLILVLEQVQKFRRVEGKKLESEFYNRLEISDKIIDKIKYITDSNLENQLEKYKSRVKSIFEGSNIDEQRLNQEISIIVEKKDITEEIVRFKAHLCLFEDFLKENEEPIGKKMNFLLQEMVREVNTVGSKTDLTKVSHLVVDLKSEIEKIREQVQNIL